MPENLYEYIRIIYNARKAILAEPSTDVVPIISLSPTQRGSATISPIRFMTMSVLIISHRMAAQNILENEDYSHLH